MNNASSTAIAAGVVFALLGVFAGFVIGAGAKCAVGLL